MDQEEEGGGGSGFLTSCHEFLFSKFPLRWTKALIPYTLQTPFPHWGYAGSTVNFLDPQTPCFEKAVLYLPPA